MVTPYLNRDESIILTTHNVNFNSRVAELILTNQRLIIFDTGHPQFRYQTIPLTTIETVITREDAQNNPVLYLSISPLTKDSAPQTKEFTFLRQTSGERRQECDVWIKQLKEQIASIRQQRLLAVQSSLSEDTDIIFDEPAISIPEPVPNDSTLPGTTHEMSESTVSLTSTIIGVDTGSTLVIPDLAPVAWESDEPVTQAMAEETTKEPLSSRFHPPPVSSTKPNVIALTAIIIVVLAIAGGLFIYSTTMPEGNPVEPITPVITPTSTTAAVTTVQTTAVQQTPSPQITFVPTPQPMAVIPEKGVWVKVNYEGNYLGRVGISGDMRQVNASGEKFYQLPITEGIVEASIQKQDGTGKVITVEIYQNGRMIARSIKATPGATVDLRAEVKKA